ncbi:unnamed protein product [Meganyctiphanes norvegica]|uniref:C-type lectin domain-containing protein n=1 Tax=Meganyctiphanes norvegica TaxID=48144 RepID=A0AAV2RRK5_MEGNR
MRVLPVLSLLTTLVYCEPEVNSHVEAQVNNKRNIVCEPPFKWVGEDCLYFNYRKQIDFYTSLWLCRSLTGYMAEPTNRDVLLKYMEENYKELPVRTHFFLGASDIKKEGQWTWESSKGKVDPSIWSEKPMREDGENCMAVIYNGDGKFKINDEPCDNNFNGYTICEQH